MPTRFSLLLTLPLLALGAAACHPDSPAAPSTSCDVVAGATAPAASIVLGDFAGRAGVAVDAELPVPDSLVPLFNAAAREFDVPATLLESLAREETRFHMVRGAVEFAGRPAAFGVMALRGPRLLRGAALAGVSADAARGDVAANIRAAAALLSAEAGAHHVERSRPAAWLQIIAAYRGIDPATLGAAPLRASLSTCPTGGGGDGGGGAPDYAPAVWRPSPNYDSRLPPPEGDIRMIIIHTCEGSYAGCWSWLVNPASGVSTHYVVSETGAEISELVSEPWRAWHIGATYDCSLDDDRECSLNGVQSNHFTVGIEHGGYASQTSFPAGQIEASARLVCDITRDRGVPRDWHHIVGHGRLQPANRTDPGPHWPWTHYMALIQRDCGETVVDDAAALNDDAFARVAVPAGWTAASATPGWYGSGYHWASTTTQPAGGVAFSFRVDSAATYLIEARWTGGANRARDARFALLDAAGDTLDTVTIDERGDGSDWHALGRWPLEAGWNFIVLTRAGEAGKVVVADAVRIR